MPRLIFGSFVLLVARGKEDLNVEKPFDQLIGNENSVNTTKNFFRIKKENSLKQRIKPKTF